MERKNLIVGMACVIVFMCLGAFLEMNHLTKWVGGMTRGMWSLAHAHGTLFGVLNIIIGLLIINLKLDGKAMRIGSILAIVGVLVFPLGLFLDGINMKFEFIAPLGGLSMIAAWVLTLYSAMIKKG